VEEVDVLWEEAEVVDDPLVALSLSLADVEDDEELELDVDVDVGVDVTLSVASSVLLLLLLSLVGFAEAIIVVEGSEELDAVVAAALLTALTTLMVLAILDTVAVAVL
jgi:hypothetical protein